MAKKIINIGKSQNKGDGDPLRTAFSKVNDNFDELYSGSFTDTTDFTTSIIPRTDNEISLGSSTKRWSELYVKDFIFVNGVRLSGSAAGDLIVGGNIVQVNDIVGSIFADDSTLMMDGQTGKHYGPLIGDVTGSVFADNSTVLIDGVAGTISAGALTGALPALDGSALTGVSAGALTGALPALDGSALTGVIASSMLFSNITSKPTTIAGYGITDAYTKTEVDSAITSSVLPSGSTQSIDIVAQDSTVLVDSVNGTLNATTLTGALPAINGSALTNVTTTFANITSTPTTISGYGITDAYTKTEVDAQISAPTGDLTGSVFGDDSTLLVDGINNKIVGAVETSSLRTSETSITLGNNAQSEGSYSLSIGTGARSDTYGVAIGMQTQAATYDINVGAFSGKNHYTSSGAYRVAVGAFAQQNANPGDETGTGAIAIGTLAGDANQGANAVAIGRYAGRNNQAAKSIVINATDSDLENTTADSLVIKPIRNAVGTTMLMYDATSGEVTHSGSIQESFATTNGATGVTALDCSTGNIHYLTAPAGDITANFTNLNLTAEYATNVTVVIDQGGTEREITAVQIGGVAQTIVWQGNSAPTGTANGVDSFSFTILNDGGTYVVLGQMVAFGGV